MNRWFADSFYFMAMLNRDDAAHERAASLTRALRHELTPTAWILAEVGDAMAAPQNRASFLSLLRLLHADPHATIVAGSDSLFERGVELFEDRPDKEWSLTDCISFVVMEDHGITEALTGDRHFQQAGFRALLA